MKNPGEPCLVYSIGNSITDIAVEFAIYRTSPKECLEFIVCFFCRKWLSIWLKWWNGKEILNLLNATFATHLAHLLPQLLLLAITGVMQVRAHDIELVEMSLTYFLISLFRSKHGDVCAGCNEMVICWSLETAACDIWMEHFSYIWSS